MHWVDLVRAVDTFVHAGLPAQMESRLVSLKGAWCNEEVALHHTRFHDGFTCLWGSFHIRVTVEMLLPGLLSCISNQRVSAFAVFNLHICHSASQ